MKCELIRDMTGPQSEEFPDGIKPKGTIIDHPQAHLLVLRGVATAADEECMAKAPMSAKETATAAFYYARTEAGIDPDDFEAYAKGYLIGYEPDGTWKPGPNYADFEQKELDQQINDSEIITEV